MYDIIWRYAFQRLITEASRPFEHPSGLAVLVRAVLQHWSWSQLTVLEGGSGRGDVTAIIAADYGARLSMLRLNAADNLVSVEGDEA